MVSYTFEATAWHLKVQPVMECYIFGLYYLYSWNVSNLEHWFSHSLQGFQASIHPLQSWMQQKDLLSKIKLFQNTYHTSLLGWTRILHNLNLFCFIINKQEHWIGSNINCSPPYNFSTAWMTVPVTTSNGVLESWKQSSAMIMEVGLIGGATSGNCRITPPTLLKIIGSLANHPRYKHRNKKINLEKKNGSTLETWRKIFAYCMYISKHWIEERISYSFWSFKKN